MSISSILCQETKIMVIMTNIDINKQIGIKIKLLRTKSQFSQEKLAKKADMNKNTIGLIERGEISPSIETLYKIANALNIKLKELVDVSKIDL